MWLLDKNVPIQLAALLGELGVEAATADSKGFGSLTNGELVVAAVEAGVSCILTRDRLFSESASRSLKIHRGVCLVVLTLPQGELFPRVGFIVTNLSLPSWWEGEVSEKSLA